MKPYNWANLDLTPYSPWRLIVLAWVGRALGVVFHVNGIPFGDGRKRGIPLVRGLVHEIRNRPAVDGRTGA